MTDNIFNAVPNIQNTDKLNELTKKILCQKLSAMLKQIAEQLNIDLSQEISNFDKGAENIINPALYYYYFKLKEAITSEELDQILDVISLLVNQPLNLLRKDAMPNISSAADTEWERELFVNSARKDIISEFGMENKFEIIHPIFAQKLNEQINYISKAIHLLNDTDKELSYSALKNLLSIKLFEGSVRGFSYQAAYGNIYIRVPQDSSNIIAYYLEHIVHECSHQNLFAIQLLDPIVLNEKNELFDAPIRKQKRPMNGIFHACFVLSRMVRCFRKIPQYANNYSSDDNFYARINEWFNKSHETVKNYAKLSENGKLLFATLKTCAYE